MYGDAEAYKSDEKAMKMVFDAQEKSEKALEPLFETQWRRNELLYWSKRDATMWQNAMGATQWMRGSPYESSLCLPTVLQHVETRVPRLAMSLLANDPMWRAMPLKGRRAGFRPMMRRGAARSSRDMRTAIAQPAEWPTMNAGRMSSSPRRLAISQAYPSSDVFR